MRSLLLPQERRLVWGHRAAGARLPPPHARLAITKPLPCSMPSRTPALTER